MNTSTQNIGVKKARRLGGTRRKEPKPRVPSLARRLSRCTVMRVGEPVLSLYRILGILASLLVAGRY